MFKILSLAIGFYMLYRLFGDALPLGSGNEEPPEDPAEEYTDYEEVD